MPRPTRIQYEGAYYHVMNRGRARQAIFHNREYYSAFLKTLEEAHSRFDAEIHAYCLMDNHYHLLIGTPRANLNRIMRHINGVYTQRYNRLKKTDGPLFRGRYKAILVDEDAYLLQLGRYIHRNPAEVKGADEQVLEQFKWSSYLPYIRRAVVPEWLHCELTYRMLGQKQRYAGYRAYVAQGNSEDILKYYNKGNMASVLGERSFREDLRDREEEMRVSGDLSKTLSQRPELAEIVSAVAKVFKTTEDEIVRKGSRRVSFARQMAIYSGQQIGDKSLKELAEYFNFTHPGSVCPAIAAVKNRLEQEESATQYNRIGKILNIGK